jgi:hypothetical protein
MSAPFVANGADLFASIPQCVIKNVYCPQAAMFVVYCD